MELEDSYGNYECPNLKDTSGPQRRYRNEGGPGNHKRYLVVLTACLGIMCLLLIAVIILQHFQASKQGYLWGPDGLFLSTEEMSWFDSRRYCRDHGGDLVIINTEEKQRHISSFISESMWIGLTDMENEGNMIWVDSSPLKKGFWIEGEPNNQKRRNEDCVEMNPANYLLNNWNDLSCSVKKKAVCEKN